MPSTTEIPSAANASHGAAVPASAPTEVPHARDERRNYRLGVLNGAVYQAGEGFMDSGTVIPLFLSRLTTSNALIGLGSSLSDMGWFLPQFAVAPWIARFPRQLWLYRRAAVVRGAALGSLAVLTAVLADSHPHALLAAFLVCYTVYCFGAGFAALPFMEVVAKTVPRGRLGSYWAQRLFWGGLLASAVGLVVRQILRIEGAGLRFGLLFGLATISVTVGYALFSSIREPLGAPGKAAATPLAQLREGLGCLRDDAHFRRLFLARATLSLWLTASPFMVLFAVRDLAAGPRVAGTFLFARVAGFVVSNLAWQPLSRRRGNRALLRIGTLGCSLLASAAAALAVASPWWLGWIGAGPAVLGLEAVSCVGGAMQSAVTVGYASLIFELAPPGRRQTFISLMNSFLGPTLLLPALGGALVDAFNAPLVFALCSVATLIGYRAATRLPLVRPAGESEPHPVGEHA